jgi:nucleoside-diphosphate-sugar epimerase
MKRVLVTGASGFVGRHVLPLLVERGFEVCAVARTIPPHADSRVTWNAVDLLGGTGAVRALVKNSRPTHLLHLAWYAEHGAFWRSLENFRWAAASLELAREFAEQGGDRLVAAGTCAEYDWSGEVCSEASTALAPSTPYGICKDALRRMLEALAAEKKIGFAWGRVFFTFGPNERPQRLVPSVIRSLLRGEDARTTHGFQVRDFLAVEDVAAAFAALLDSNVSGAVNIGSGQPAAVRDVVAALAQQIGGTGRVEYGAIAADDQAPMIVADVTRLRQEVGWSPRAPLIERLAETIEWWRAQERVS